MNDEVVFLLQYAITIIVFGLEFILAIKLVNQSHD